MLANSVHCPSMYGKKSSVSPEDYLCNKQKLSCEEFFSSLSDIDESKLFELNDNEMNSEIDGDVLEHPEAFLLLFLFFN